MLKDDAVILFQGDSVTDAGRSREDDSELGLGYPRIVSSWLAAKYPEKRMRFLNRGISGNRVKDLRARWQEDCLELKPDILTIQPLRRNMRETTAGFSPRLKKRLRLKLFSWSHLCCLTQRIELLGGRI